MTGLKEGGRLHILSVSKDLVISGDNEGHCGVLLSVMGHSPASSLAEREHQDGRGERCCGSQTDSRAFHTALLGSLAAWAVTQNIQNYSSTKDVQLWEGVTMTWCRNFSALDNKFPGLALHDQRLASESNRVLSYTCSVPHCSLEHLTLLPVRDERKAAWPWDSVCQGIKACPASWTGLDRIAYNVSHLSLPPMSSWNKVIAMRFLKEHKKGRRNTSPRAGDTRSIWEKLRQPYLAECAY